MIYGCISKVHIITTAGNGLPPGELGLGQMWQQQHLFFFLIDFYKAHWILNSLVFTVA